MNLIELGASLKRERERRGLSMGDIMDVTKISRRNLCALEEGDVASLPHPVYLKGYVRNYAVLVGLDPEKLVAVVEANLDANMRYVLAPPTPAQPEAAIDPAESSSAAEPSSVPADPRPVSGTPEEQPVLRLGDSEPLGQKAPRRQPGSLAIVTLLLLVAVLAGLLYQYQRMQGGSSSPEAAPASVTSKADSGNASAGVAAAPVAIESAPAQPSANNGTDAGNQTAPVAEAPAAAPIGQAALDSGNSSSADAAGASVAGAASPDGKQVLTIAAKPDSVCWVGVYEGRKGTSFMLRHGQSRQVEFTKRARVLLGNAGGATVQLNGVPYSFRGTRGQKVTLEFGKR